MVPQPSLGCSAQDSYGSKDWTQKNFWKVQECFCRESILSMKTKESYMYTLIRRHPPVCSHTYIHTHTVKHIKTFTFIHTYIHTCTHLYTDVLSLFLCALALSLLYVQDLFVQHKVGTKLMTLCPGYPNSLGTGGIYPGARDNLECG